MSWKNRIYGHPGLFSPRNPNPNTVRLRLTCTWLFEQQAPRNFPIYIMPLLPKVALQLMLGWHIIGVSSLNGSMARKARLGNCWVETPTQKTSHFLEIFLKWEQILLSILPVDDYHFWPRMPYIMTQKHFRRTMAVALTSKKKHWHILASTPQINAVLLNNKWEKMHFA